MRLRMRRSWQYSKKHQATCMPAPGWNAQYRQYRAVLQSTTARAQKIFLIARLHSNFSQRLIFMSTHTTVALLIQKKSNEDRWSNKLRIGNPHVTSPSRDCTTHALTKQQRGNGFRSAGVTAGPQRAPHTHSDSGDAQNQRLIWDRQG